MLVKTKRALLQLTAAVCLSLTAVIAQAKTELTMYYPVAVGGSLTKIVDGLVADFMKENPDTNRKRIAMYAGCNISVLERLEEEGRIKLPPVLTKTQKRMGVNWNKYLGNLSGR